MKKGAIQGAHEVGFWKRHLSKIGVAGSLFSSFVTSLFAAACCLGPPALLPIFSAIGLGFLISDAVLQPMMIFFLLVSLFGLILGMRRHRNPWAVIIGILSAVTAYVFRFVSVNNLLAWLGIAGLVIASQLNVLLRQRQLKAKLAFAP